MYQRWIDPSFKLGHTIAIGDVSLFFDGHIMLVLQLKAVYHHDGQRVLVLWVKWEVWLVNVFFVITFPKLRQQKNQIRNKCIMLTWLHDKWACMAMWSDWLMAPVPKLHSELYWSSINDWFSSCYISGWWYQHGILIVILCAVDNEQE